MRPILAGAVDLARRALLELQPTGVGEHLGVTGEDECAATHRFAATLPGYRGWQWAVVVAAAPGAEYATVSESALLPGPDALVAPEFVPWDRRVRPGDLAPGDLLAPRVDDERLVPGYLETGDPVADEVCEDIGLGRRQVLSREGRFEAAERWYSEFGPDSDMARSAPGTCGVCGFFVPLAGAMRAAFGVCANSMGADGRVVHVRYGCGAHSDTEMPTGAGSPLYEAYDDAAIELIPAAESAPRPADTNDTRTQDDSANAADRTADTASPGENEPSAVVESDSEDASEATDPGTTEALEVIDADAPKVPAGTEDSDSSSTPAGTNESAVASEVETTGTNESTVPSETEAPASIGPGETAQADSRARTTPVAGDEVPGDGSESAEPAVSGGAEEDVPVADDSTTGAPDTENVAPQSDSGDAYSDAWAISAVRVRPDESGAAER